MTTLTSPSTRSKEMLSGLRNGTITTDEFYKQCVLWVLEPESWNEVVVRYLPPPPPEWTQYENMDLKDKSKVDPSFLRQPVIADYLKAREKVTGWNKGWYGWLGMAIEWLPDTKEFLDQQITLQRKRHEFKKWLDAYVPRVEQEPQETSYSEPPRLDGTAAVVAEMFGGTAV